MKKRKKILCICMMLCLAFSPAAVYADNGSDVEAEASVWGEDDAADEADADDEADDEDADDEADDADMNDDEADADEDEVDAAYVDEADAADADEVDAADADEADAADADEVDAVDADDVDDGWSDGSDVEEDVGSGILLSEMDDSELTYPLESKASDLLSYDRKEIYMGEDLDLSLDYSKYCSEEDVAEVYWSAWDVWEDGDSYSLSDLPYTAALSANPYASECPYLEAEVTDDGICLTPEHWRELYIGVLVYTVDGDYYWDSMCLEILDYHSAQYQDADIFHYRTEEYGILFLLPGETYHLKASYLDYCTEDEVEAVQLVGTDYENAVDHPVNGIPALVVEEDDTGYNLTGVLPEEGDPSVYLQIYVKLKGEEEGYTDEVFVYVVDPDNLEEGTYYDEEMHMIIADDGGDGEEDADDVSGGSAEAVVDKTTDLGDDSTVNQVTKSKDDTAAKSGADQTSGKKSTSPKTGEGGPSDEMLLLFLAAGAAAVVLLWKKGRQVG